jgi:hypothetical protein
MPVFPIDTAGVEDLATRAAFERVQDSLSTMWQAGLFAAIPARSIFGATYLVTTGEHERELYWWGGKDAGWLQIHSDRPDGTPTVKHEKLDDLLGGAAFDHWHFTAAEHLGLQDWLGVDGGSLAQGYADQIGMADQADLLQLALGALRLNGNLFLGSDGGGDRQLYLYSATAGQYLRFDPVGGTANYIRSVGQPLQIRSDDYIFFLTASGAGWYCDTDMAYIRTRGAAMRFSFDTATGEVTATGWLHLASGAHTVALDGELAMFDARKAFEFYIGSMLHTAGGVIYRQTTTAAGDKESTTSYTDCSSDCDIPSGLWAVGTVVRVTASGIASYYNGDGTPNTRTNWVRLELGTETIIELELGQSVAAGSRVYRRWTIEVELVCTSTTTFRIIKANGWVTEATATAPTAATTTNDMGIRKMAYHTGDCTEAVTGTVRLGCSGKVSNLHANQYVEQQSLLVEAF